MKGKSVYQTSYWKYILSIDKKGCIGVRRGYFNNDNMLEYYKSNIITLDLPPWGLEENAVEYIFDMLKTIKLDVEHDCRILDERRGAKKCLLIFNQTKPHRRNQNKFS